MHTYIIHNNDYRRSPLWAEQLHLPDTQVLASNKGRLWSRSECTGTRGKDITLKSFVCGIIVQSKTLDSRETTQVIFLLGWNSWDLFFRNQNIKNEFLQWKVTFNGNSLSVPGRVLSSVKLFQGARSVSRLELAIAPSAQNPLITTMVAFYPLKMTSLYERANV